MAASAPVSAAAKEILAYRDLMLCDLLLQNPSLHEESFSFFHSLKLIVEQIPKSCD